VNKSYRFLSTCKNCIARHLIYFATQVPRVYHLLAVGAVLANQQIEQWVEPAQGADACCVMWHE